MIDWIGLSSEAPKPRPSVSLAGDRVGQYSNSAFIRQNVRLYASCPFMPTCERAHPAGPLPAAGLRMATPGLTRPLWVVCHWQGGGVTIVDARPIARWEIVILPPFFVKMKVSGGNPCPSPSLNRMDQARFGRNLLISIAQIQCHRSQNW